MSRRGPPRLYQKHLPRPPPQDFRFRDVLSTTTEHFFVFKITSSKQAEFGPRRFVCALIIRHQKQAYFSNMYAKDAFCGKQNTRIYRTRMPKTCFQQARNVYFSNTCATYACSTTWKRVFLEHVCKVSRLETFPVQSQRRKISIKPTENQQKCKIPASQRHQNHSKTTVK